MYRSRFTVGSATALLLTLAMAASAQSTTPSFDAESFDAYVAQAVVDWQVPGLAIAVIKDDDIVFAKGYGVRVLGDATGSDPVDADTLFQIGSTTKAMTAATVGLLVDEGKLTWDDAVVDHLPYFQLSTAAHTQAVTLRDLLSHRTGLGNTDHLWYIVPHTPEAIISQLRHIEPAYPFRAGFVYQNIMYVTAGEVVAKVGGTPWYEFVQERLLTPLGMERSVVTAARAYDMPNVARAHTPYDGTIRPVQHRYEAIDPDLAAAGMVWSSVNDMARWVRMLLNEGELEGTRFLSQKIVAELLSPQNIIPRGNFYPTARFTKPHWTTYALGWFQQDYQGRAVSFHTGTYDGMSAIVGMIPDEELGVVVLANLNSADVRHALMLRTFDLFAGGHAQPRDWSADLRAMYAEMAAQQDAARTAHEKTLTRIEGTRPTLALEQYAGVYVNELHGHITITHDNGILHYALAEAIPGTVEHWHYDTFRVRLPTFGGPSLFITFTLGPDGTPNKIEDEAGEAFRRREPGD